MFRASVLNKVCPGLPNFRQSFCRNMPDSRNSAVGKPQSGALRCIVFLVRCSPFAERSPVSSKEYQLNASLKAEKSTEAPNRDGE